MGSERWLLNFDFYSDLRGSGTKKTRRVLPRRHWIFDNWRGQNKFNRLQITNKQQKEVAAFTKHPTYFDRVFIVVAFNIATYCA